MKAAQQIFAVNGKEILHIICKRHKKDNLNNNVSSKIHDKNKKEEIKDCLYGMLDLPNKSAIDIFRSLFIKKYPKKKI
jgi:hypothetical protein